MGTWLIPADLLARSRFVISPLLETGGAQGSLAAPTATGMPWERAFHVAHREAYGEWLAADPRRAAMAGSLSRPRRGRVPGWVADLVNPPPLGDGASFEDELEQVLAWDDDRGLT